jgi:hypothetical protein
MKFIFHLAFSPLLIFSSLPVYSQTSTQIADDLIKYEASRVKQNCYQLKRMNDMGKSAFREEVRSQQIVMMIEKFNMSATQAKDFVGGMDIAVSRLCPNIW